MPEVVWTRQAVQDVEDIKSYISRTFPRYAALVAERIVAAVERLTPTAVRGGGPIVGVIFFTGCSANERGICDMVVDFQAYTPDGKPWSDPQHAELWVEKPPPPPNRMQLSVGNLGLVIEPKDPLGEYKVKADILDRVTKKRMVLERTFNAIEGQGP